VFVLEAVYQAPVAFTGASRRSGGGGGAQYALLLDHRFTAGDAFGIFTIKGSCLGCRAALFWNHHHFDIPLQGSFVNTQRGAGLDLPAGFGALAMQVNFAADDRLTSQFTGLEKTRSPQPFIEAHGVR